MLKLSKHPVLTQLCVCACVCLTVMHVMYLPVQICIVSRQTPALYAGSPHSVTGDGTETAAAHRIFSTQSLRGILNNKYHTNNEWASGCSCLQGIISNFLPMFHIPTSSCSYSLWLKPSLLSTALIYFSNQHVNPAGTRLLHSSVDKLRQTDGHTNTEC